MSVQYVRLNAPELISVAPEDSSTWFAVWSLTPVTALNSSNKTGLGNWWVHASDGFAAGARLPNNKIINDNAMSHMQQPADMITQHLPWINNLTSLATPQSEQPQTLVTRLVSYEHSSFVSTRETGQVSVHAWLNTKLYVQVVCRGKYRSPHPVLTYDTSFKTWYQQDDQTHIGLIPYIFRTSSTYNNDRVDQWVLPAGANDRIMHNMVLIPDQLSYYTGDLPQVKSV